MICDYCNKDAELVGGDIIYPHRPDLYELKFYYCAVCEAWCGCHRGTTKPLGRLANAELRQAIGMMNVEQCQHVVEICGLAVQDREVMGK